ncbi:MAG: cyclopropane-fatty-acyl-phospholipid synthase, partial [Pseudomonadota bacterium]|nr:cyclopropane-fatty-acyl-phospholipid synthase [Pseudomonadota bacterium]
MKPSIVPTIDEVSSPGHGSALQQLGRKLFLAKLAQFREGELTVVEGSEQFTFGRRTPACNLRATIEILHPQTYADAAFGGTVGGGEAYIRGLWRTDD